MFLSRGTNWFLSGRVYPGRLFSDPGRFFSVPVLSGKRNLDPKGTCKFSIRFRLGFSGPG